ncbi:MAG TPA: hypothetical protein PKV15_03970 [Syntrophomonadaceae bacterium]|nr:hypothetical protein [Syntrophomonadaceae bacterium]HRX20442.1 hypothetical protein [Syntrophomonadaceae bacterium]
MEILRILDELEVLFKGSRKLPFGYGTIVDADRFLDRLDKIRAILPEDIMHAKLVINEKDRIVNEAYQEAQKYVEKSQDTVARMVEENEITRAARITADEIIANAEQTAKEIRRDANEYAESILIHMEIVLKKAVETINQGKYEIRQGLENDDF